MTMTSRAMNETHNLICSEHTVMIIAPDETGLPPGEGYQYTLFPRLQDELFALEEPPDYREERHRQPRPRRVSDTFAFGRRTKQEVRAMQKASFEKSNLYYTRGITPKRGTSREIHLRDLASELHSSEKTAQR